NWTVIVGLYDRLAALQSTPFVDLNRAVAIYYAAGPEDALNALSNSNYLSWLKNYYLYYAVLGKIYTKLKRNVEATKAYEQALSLRTLRAEEDFVRTKLLTIQRHLH